MKKFKIKTITLIFISALFSLVPYFVQADIIFSAPSIGQANPAGVTDTISLINYIYLASIGIVGIIAMANFMIAGFLWLTAGGNASFIKNAQTRIQNTILGVIFLLSAVLVLNIINPDLTVLRPLESIGINLGGQVVGYGEECGTNGNICASGLFCDPRPAGLAGICRQTKGNLQEQEEQGTEIEDIAGATQSAPRTNLDCSSLQPLDGEQWIQFPSAFCPGSGPDEICCKSVPR